MINLVASGHPRTIVGLIRTGWQSKQSDALQTPKIVLKIRLPTPFPPMTRSCNMLPVVGGPRALQLHRCSGAEGESREDLRGVVAEVPPDIPKKVSAQGCATNHARCLYIARLTPLMRSRVSGVARTIARTFQNLDEGCKQGVIQRRPGRLFYFGCAHVHAPEALGSYPGSKG